MKQFRFEYHKADDFTQALSDFKQKCDVDNIRCFVGTMGREEFMMILRSTDASSAAFITDLIRQCFANTAFPAVSLGVTQEKQSC